MAGEVEPDAADAVAVGAVEPGVGEQLLEPGGGAGVVAGVGNGFDVDEGVADE